VSIYELEIGWARTAEELRYLRWELLACEDVLAAFRSARDDVLIVLFAGGPSAFLDWANELAPRAAA
jgi:hypothetical protein